MSGFFISNRLFFTRIFFFLDNDLTNEKMKLRSAWIVQSGSKNEDEVFTV